MIDETRLREILEDELGCELEGVEADTLLFRSGIVVSFALVTLMMSIEKEAGFRVGPGDVVLENFDSIARILGFIGRNTA